MLLIQQPFCCVWPYLLWSKFRINKGGVKAYVLYDLEVQVPVFYSIATASRYDSITICLIRYEPNVYCISDRVRESFKELYRICLAGSFFVVRAKANLKYIMVKWMHRIPKYVLTDAEVKLTGYLLEKRYLASF